MGVAIWSEDNTKELWQSSYSTFHAFVTYIKEFLECNCLEIFLGKHKYANHSTALHDVYISGAARDFYENFGIITGSIQGEECKQWAQILTVVQSKQDEIFARCFARREYFAQQIQKFIDGLMYCYEHNQRVIFC